MPFDCPLPPAVLEAALAAAGLPPAPRVLDLGCGSGRMLAFVQALTGGSAVGVDLFPGTLPGSDLRVGDMASFEDGSFDLVICVGALAGERVATLRSFHRHAPRLLLAELIRTRPLHGPLTVLPDLGQLRRELAESGWRPRSEQGVGGAAMVEYEATWMRNVEAFVAAHPADPDVPAFRAHLAERRTWMRADCLDFVLIGAVGDPSPAPRGREPSRPAAGPRD